LSTLRPSNWRASCDLFRLDAALRREPAPEAADQIVVVRRVGGLRRHPGRLIDRDQVLVLIEDPLRAKVGPERLHEH
jgi:hypothetical protein